MEKTAYYKLLLAVVVCTVLTVPSASFAEGCQGQKWCFETDEYAFRITPEEMIMPVLQNIADNPDGRAVTQVIEYAGQHGDRIYLAWLRPTPTMHIVDINWNVGLRLKSGEVVWANAWLIDERDVFSAYAGDSSRLFVPQVNSMSTNGHSFKMFLAFPNRTLSGEKWEGKKVSAMVIQDNGGEFVAGSSELIYPPAADQ